MATFGLLAWGPLGLPPLFFRGFVKPNTVGATPNPANPGALTGLEVR